MMYCHPDFPLLSLQDLMMSDGKCVVCNTKLHNIKVFKYHKCARQFLHRFSNNDEETNFKSRVEEGVEFTKRWMEKQISHELSGDVSQAVRVTVNKEHHRSQSDLDGRLSKNILQIKKKKSDYVHS